MAKYRITDPSTGRTMTVSGDAPPSPEDIDYLFSQAPPPASANIPEAPVVPPEAPTPSATGLVNELVAGAARPLASLVDIAASPYQAFRVYVQGKPQQSVRSMIGERGQFAGPGLATDIAASTGEFASMGLSMTSAARGLAANLLDDAMKYGESAARGVLRQFGQATPAQDILAATTGAIGTETGGAVGEAVGGATGRQVGQAVGGFGVPVGAAPILNRLNNSVDSLLRKAAPTAQEIKGAGRLLYQQIEDLGIVFNEQSTNRLVGTLQQVAAKEDLSGLRRDSPVSGQYRVVMNMLAKDGDFTGTQYSMLDKASSTFRDIANTKQGEDAGRIASRLAEQIDNFLMEVSPKDLAYFKGQTEAGTQIALPGLAPIVDSGLPVGDVAEVGKTLVNARGLWRRASAAGTIEAAIERARVASLGIGRSGADYDKELGNSLRQMLLENPNKFNATERKKVEAALSGGRVRNVFEVLSQFGIKSNDYIMASLLGMGAGMVARDNVSDAAAFGVAAVAGTKAFSVAMGQVVSKMFKTDVNMMKAAVSAGPNARAQVRNYMANVPAAERSPKQLGTLLVSSGADLSQLEGLPTQASSFLADSVAFAVALRTLVEEEQEQPTE